MKRAIYALSADPLTQGHLNIIDRALKLFDEIIIGIGINPDKKYTFTLEERESLAREVMQKCEPRVTVKSFPGLLSDFAYENGIRTVIRGARNSTDFDFERLLNDINQTFKQGIETIVYIADQNFSHISSSAAKELAKNQADNLIEYVPMTVKRALERRIRGQYFIGVTGGIGCGKSYVTDALVTYHRNSMAGIIPGDDRYIAIHNVDLDIIGHNILEIAMEPIYVQTREKIANDFGKDLLDAQGKIKTPELSTRIFNDPSALREFDAIMRGPMSLYLRRRLMTLRGIILINSALIAEAGISSMVNNDVIMVCATEKTQIARLKERGYSDDAIKQRLARQLSIEEKVEILRKECEKHGCGNTIIFGNDSLDGVRDIDKLYTRIKTEMLHHGVR